MMLACFNFTPVQLQMVDFIEVEAVPINGMGTLNKNKNEIIFLFQTSMSLKLLEKQG